MDADGTGAAQRRLVPAQERSRRRRAQLLQAALDLLADPDTGPLTHRNVTARAGAPPATLGYYFSSIDDLTDAALVWWQVRRVDAVRAIVAPLAAAPTPPGPLAERLAAALVPEVPATAALAVQLRLRAARSDVVASALVESRRDLEEVVTAALEAAGTPDAPDVTAAVLAIADGVALQLVARPALAGLRTAFAARLLRTVLCAGTSPGAEAAPHGSTEAASPAPTGTTSGACPG